MATYKLLRGKHSARVGEKQLLFTAGDIVELTDSQYAAFSDKFEPAFGASVSNPAILEPAVKEPDITPKGDPDDITHPELPGGERTAELP